NAGNRDAVAPALSERIGDFEAVVDDVSDAYALLAIQGPASESIMAAVPGITDVTVSWDEQKNYAWASARYNGEPLLLARTGYTGEDGFELLVRSEDA